MRESIKYALKEIRRRKQRTAGSIISYLIVGAIIVVAASITGITHDTSRRVLWDIGAHTVAYIPRMTIEGCCIQTYPTDLYDPDREGFVMNNAPTNLIFDEQIEMIRQSPNVADASPYLVFRIRSSLGSGEWTIGGIDLTRPVAYSATVVARSQLVSGKFIEPGEPDLVMVEEEFAGVYNLEAGSEIVIGDIPYTVAAIVKPPLRPGKANIYMSLPALRELVKTRLDEHAENPTNGMLVESKGAQYHEAALVDISNILGQSSRISSYGCYQPGVTVMGITESTAWTLTVILVLTMLLVAIKIQHSSIVQRSFDIGVLKAIGWRDRNIVAQIFTESLIFSLVGGITGVAVSVAVLQSLPAELLEGTERVVNPVLLVIGVIIPAGGGLLAGITASAKALNTKTADILRTI